MRGQKAHGASKIEPSTSDNGALASSKADANNKMGTPKKKNMVTINKNNMIKKYTNGTQPKAGGAAVAARAESVAPGKPRASFSDHGDAHAVSSPTRYRGIGGKADPIDFSDFPEPDWSAEASAREHEAEAAAVAVAAAAAAGVPDVKEGLCEYDLVPALATDSESGGDDSDGQNGDYGCKGGRPCNKNKGMARAIPAEKTTDVDAVSGRGVGEGKVPESVVNRLAAAKNCGGAGGDRLVTGTTPDTGAAKGTRKYGANNEVDFKKYKGCAGKVTNKADTNGDGSYYVAPNAGAANRTNTAISKCTTIKPTSTINGTIRFKAPNPQMVRTVRGVPAASAASAACVPGAVHPARTVNTAVAKTNAYIPARNGAGAAALKRGRGKTTATNAITATGANVAASVADATSGIPAKRATAEKNVTINATTKKGVDASYFGVEKGKAAATAATTTSPILTAGRTTTGDTSASNIKATVKNHTASFNTRTNGGAATAASKEGEGRTIATASCAVRATGANTKTNATTATTTGGAGPSKEATTKVNTMFTIKNGAAASTLKEEKRKAVSTAAPGGDDGGGTTTVAAAPAPKITNGEECGMDYSIVEKWVKQVASGQVIARPAQMNRYFRGRIDQGANSSSISAVIAALLDMWLPPRYCFLHTFLFAVYCKWAISVNSIADFFEWEFRRVSEISLFQV